MDLLGGMAGGSTKNWLTIWSGLVHAIVGGHSGCRCASCRGCCDGHWRRAGVLCRSITDTARRNWRAGIRRNLPVRAVIKPAGAMSLCFPIAVSVAKLSGGLARRKNDVAVAVRLAWTGRLARSTAASNLRGRTAICRGRETIRIHRRRTPDFVCCAVNRAEVFLARRHHAVHAVMGRHRCSSCRCTCRRGRRRR